MVQSLRQWQVADLIGIGGAYYTSQKIFGDPDQGGTLLLAPGQGPINVLGKAYVRARVLDNDFRGGRQLVDTPLISPRDNRMVPITYEAATINSVPDKDRMYDYAAGYLWNTKLRDSNDFKPMSDALAGRGRRRPRGAIWDGQGSTDHRNGSHRHGLQHRALHQYGFCPGGVSVSDPQDDTAMGHGDQRHRPKERSGQFASRSAVPHFPVFRKGTGEICWLDRVRRGIGDWQ